jgi:hypothetical protein
MWILMLESYAYKKGEIKKFSNGVAYVAIASA